MNEPIASNPDSTPQSQSVIPNVNDFIFPALVSVVAFAALSAVPPLKTAFPATSQRVIVALTVGAATLAWRGLRPTETPSLEAPAQAPVQPTVPPQQPTTLENESEGSTRTDSEPAMTGSEPAKTEIAQVVEPSVTASPTTTDRRISLASDAKAELVGQSLVADNGGSAKKDIVGDFQAVKHDVSNPSEGFKSNGKQGLEEEEEEEEEGEGFHLVPTVTDQPFEMTNSYCFVEQDSPDSATKALSEHIRQYLNTNKTKANTAFLDELNRLSEEEAVQFAMQAVAGTAIVNPDNHKVFRLQLLNAMAPHASLKVRAFLLGQLIKMEATETNVVEQFQKLSEGTLLQAVCTASLFGLRDTGPLTFQEKVCCEPTDTPEEALHSLATECLGSNEELIEGSGDLYEALAAASTGLTNSAGLRETVFTQICQDHDQLQVMTKKSNSSIYLAYLLYSDAELATLGIRRPASTNLSSELRAVSKALKWPVQLWSSSKQKVSSRSIGKGKEPIKLARVGNYFSAIVSKKQK